MAWFNSSSNWGSDAGQIGPGTTVHLCGTFTAPAGASGYLTFQGSGSSGSPITLIADQGVVTITATYWSGHIIEIGQHSYITINGGNNLTIQATANGTALANQADYGECIANSNFGGTISNVIVEGITCSNLYVDSSLADNGGEDTYGIDIFNCSDCTFQNNTLHDMKWAIRTGWMNGYSFSNLIVAGNNIYNMDHGWFGSDNEGTGTATVSGVYVYGNTLGSMVNWDNGNDYNHHDWFHLNATSPTSAISNVFLYNNVGIGDPGAYAGTGFFSNPNYSGTESNIYVFNNLFVNTSTTHTWACGFFAFYGIGTTLLANNTFVSNAAGGNKDNGIHWGSNGVGLSAYNNVLQNISNASVYIDPSVSVAAINYNDYYLSPSWYWKGSWLSTLATWQSSSSEDGNATMANPLLTENYHLTSSSSAAWKTGTNLYSTCSGQATPGLGALCLDRAGVQRQQTGNWDMGAYEDSASNAPSAPSGLTAVVQ